MTTSRTQKSINDRPKEPFQGFPKIEKGRRNVKSLQTEVAKDARKMPIEFIRTHIAFILYWGMHISHSFKISDINGILGLSYT